MEFTGRRTTKAIGDEAEALALAHLQRAGLTLVARNRRSERFLNFFWNATSLEAVQHEITTHGSHDPFSHLASHAMQAQTHHARYGAAKLEEAGSAGIGHVRYATCGTDERSYAQPFERGFGTTIGNSLRRILLSSLEGAAVTAIISTMPLVKVSAEIEPISGQISGSRM